MKTFKLVFVIVTVLIIGLMSTTCTRTAVDDPDMTGYAGYQVILSGTANPSSLFINQGTGWIRSNITMKAKYNNGTPFPNGRIMMKINDEFGQFASTNKRYAYITTDSQGIARVQYKVNRMSRNEIGSEYLALIQAVLKDDQRLDIDEALIYDLVPIKLLTDVVEEEVNTFAYQIINNPDQDSTPDNNITIDDASITNDISFLVLLRNSTGTDTINYQVSVADLNGIISSPIDGSTGSTDNTETITIDSTVPPVAGNTAQIVFVVTSPSELAGQSVTITITIN